ncbi:MAG: sigma-70 family RNA polymerase sigma factor [Bacteroidota bacterium]
MADSATFGSIPYSTTMPLDNLREAVESDKALYEAARSEPAKFSRIFDRYYPAIFGYALRRTADIHAAADIASDTFAKAFTSFPKFEWREIRLSSWLYRIATNELSAHFRRRTLHLEIRIVDAPADGALATSIEEDRAEIEAEFRRHQQYRWLKEAIDRLAPRYQSVLSLRYVEKKSLKEIAEILDKPEGTIKSLLSRGTTQLRKKWREQGSNGDDNRQRQ